MAGAVNRRGDVVVIALPGDYGKPRPALVVRSDAFASLPSVSVCPFFSTLRDDLDLFRLAVEPDATNGLRSPSQVAIDKIVTVPNTRVGATVGRLDDDMMASVTRALALYLGVT